LWREGIVFTGFSYGLATPILPDIRRAGQAEFVFWWDNHAEKDKGGGDVRRRNTRNRSVTGVRAGEDGIPERMTIHSDVSAERELVEPPAYAQTSRV
jgi:hypothetical protein